MVRLVAKGAIILILALVTPALQATGEKALGLNSAGYDAYTGGNYSQARELFGAAIKEDDTSTPITTTRASWRSPTGPETRPPCRRS